MRLRLDSMNKVWELDRVLDEEYRDAALCQVMGDVLSEEKRTCCPRDPNCPLQRRQHVSLSVWHSNIPCV